MSKLIDLTGKRFTKLTVIERVKNDEWGNVRWLCKCKCGNFRTARGAYLRGGFVRSCGCLGRGGPQIHGMCDTSEYRAWDNAKSRCYNPKNSMYKYYGGRGIRMCDRWLHSFENFYTDMGRRPGPGYSIERSDNDSDYTPDNCVWATAKEQAGNTRRNRRFKATSIIGREYISKNQAKFAREHYLDQASINHCLNDKQQYHKGWTFTYI